MLKSVWQETALPEFGQLDGDAKTDVLIIGGGIAGILTAYFLQQNGIKYMLVEKDRICEKTRAIRRRKSRFSMGSYTTRFYEEMANPLQSCISGKHRCIQSIRRTLCRTVQCDYEIKHNFVYSFNGRKIEKEMEALQKIGCRAEYCAEIPLPIKTAGVVKVPNQAQFNPLKFLAGIAGGLNIYENTFIREMIGYTAVTDRGRIIADQVVCATHFPFINKHGSYFLKLYQSQDYVIALENAQNVGGMYADEADAGMSFRNYGSLLLLGGGGGRTGGKNGGWAELRNFAHQYYPQSSEKYFWAAQDCMSLDGMPYIGYTNGQEKRIY